MWRRVVFPPPVATAILVLAALVSAAACTSDGAKESSDSGVAGVVVLASSCPVLPDTDDCPDQPMAAHLAVTAAGSSRVVTSVDTGSDGSFRIVLAPGAYTLTPTNTVGAPMPSAYPISFDVREREFTTLTVKFDSGVR
jgi:hypothetical protein